VKARAHFLALFAPFVVLSACGGSPPPAETAPPSAGGKTIEVPLLAKSGSHLSGKATFAEVAGGVRVTVDVAGAPPGKVATHVHEKGDCSAPDAASAGGHFNPGSHPHGLPPDPTRHLGDLGNIEIKPDGTGRTEIVVQGASLAEGDPRSFLGRAIIVHEKQDDGGQPVGNAGGRIGCGVISATGR
jgi:Cu-Zn family superoxide dismutase